MSDLIKELQKEVVRCRELMEVYSTIPTGLFGYSMIKIEVQKAEDSIQEQDTVQMVRSLAELRQCN